MMHSPIILVLFLIVESVLAFHINFKELEYLLNDEKRVFSSINNYIESQENKLKVIKQFVQNNEKSSNSEDISTTLENPLLTYSTIKNLYFKRRQMKRIFGSESGLIDNNFNQKFQAINSSLFEDAASSLSWLTIIYDLDIKLLIEGKIKYKSNSGEIKTIDTNKTLDVFDCYSMGWHSLSYNNFALAQIWLEEALRLGTNDSLLEYKILGLLSQTYYKSGEKSKAFDYLQQSLSLFIETEDQMDYIYNFQTLLLNDSIATEKYLQLLVAANETVIKSELNATKVVKELCQRERYSIERINSSLSCYFLNTTLIPYLRLTRICVEELHKRPQILFFHNFVTESELKSMLNTTKSNPNPVFYDEPGRITENFHLISYENKAVNTINQLIGGITGVDMSHKTHGLVHKYNTGGQYKIHKDSHDITDYIFNKTELGYDALATFLTYWNDVEMGGQTIFPELNVTVWPERRGAVLWFNYLKSGEEDLMMMHGSCPILVGVKYVLFKPVSYLELWQKLTRPCSLDKDEFNFIPLN